MDDKPRKYYDEVFGLLFEEAKIARMTKKEKNNYYKSLKNLRDMNLAKIELNKLHNTIAIMGNDLAAKDNALAAMGNDLAARDNALALMGNDLAAMKKAYAAKEKENAELRRKLGLLN